MAELKTKLLRDEEVLDVKVDYTFIGSGYNAGVLNLYSGYLFVTNMRIIFEPDKWWTTLDDGFNLDHSKIREVTGADKFYGLAGGRSGYMTFVTMKGDKYKLEGINNWKEICHYLETEFYSKGAREIEKKVIKAALTEKNAVKISDYKKAISIWEELGEEYEIECIEKIIEEKIGKAKDKERLLDFDSAIQIWERLGEIDEAARVRKTKAKERERARDYETAIQIWERLGEIDEAARVRKLQAELGSVKVAQKVVHGDDITKTEIKDSVLNRSNIGGGSSKMQELEKLAEMKEKGLIDDDEFKQMKKEILGK